MLQIEEIKQNEKNNADKTLDLERLLLKVDFETEKEERLSCLTNTIDNILRERWTKKKKLKCINILFFA